MRHKIISIEGNIGAGKTTLATKIAASTGRKLVLEQFEQNPFLADFYADPARYAFHTELFFLSERFEQWRQMPNVPIVADYSLAKSLYFAEITLHDAEFEVFNRIYHGLTSLAQQPDLTLYLYRSTDQLTQNIRDRGRSYEQQIPTKYLEQIQDNYLKNLKLSNKKPIVIVDARKRDFLNNEADYQWILSLLDVDFDNGLSEV